MLNAFTRALKDSFPPARSAGLKVLITIAATSCSSLLLLLVLLVVLLVHHLQISEAQLSFCWPQGELDHRSNVNSVPSVW